MGSCSARSRVHAGRGLRVIIFFRNACTAAQGTGSKLVARRRAGAKGVAWPRVTPACLLGNLSGRLSVNVKSKKVINLLSVATVARGKLYCGIQVLNQSNLNYR